MSNNFGENKPRKQSLNPLLQGQRESDRPSKPVPTPQDALVEIPAVDLATAVILLEVSAAESRTSIHQKGIIQASLQTLYGLSEEASLAAMQQAQNTLRSMRGSSAFANALRDQLDTDAKRYLLKTMDDVIRADGTKSDMEIYLRNRFRMLMGLPEDEGIQPAVAKASGS